MHRVDVFLISTSIPTFETVVGSLPLEAMRESQVLVVEVLSVKAFPKTVLLKALPTECDIICTHPMFGPESGKHGWYGLPFVFEIVRSKSWDRARRFLAIFEEARCRMVCMPAEEHDRHAANTQFLTHFMGRILATHGCASTSIDLAGFKSLCKVVDTTCKDSFDLFYGLFKYNAASADTISRLKKSFSDIESKLQSHGSLQLAGAPRAVGDGEVLHISSIVSSISASKTAEVQALSKQLQDEGHQINSALCIGEPDYPPPVEVLNAVGTAADAGHTHDTVVQGDAEVRQQICTDLQERKGVAYDPAEICISNGGKQSVYQAIMAVCDEGDEVLVPTPCWVSYHDIAALCRAVPVPISTEAADGYILRPGPLEAALQSSGSKCRVLVLCNPNNPTGAVIPRDVLEEIASILRQPRFSHVYVLADEIYEQMVFDTPHVCFASLDGMRDRTLLVGGFSKAYAMTGFRLGFLAGDRRVVAAATKLQGHITGHASSISQQAGLVALRDVPPEWVTARVDELRRKRDFVVAKLRAIAGVVCAVPEGAFYVLPDLSACFEPGGQVSSGEEFCKVLLRDHKVALVPGEAFHMPMSARISYAASMEDLESAMAAFSACVEHLRHPASAI